MTYKINGTEILIQPTTGKWVARQAVGIDGAGHTIYPGVREFEMRWQLISPSGVNQLQTYFNGINPTGTAVVDLPQYGSPGYNFFSYSGCVLREPEQNTYFNEYHTDVLLLVSNIRT